MHIVIISTCLNNKKGQADFHFNGFYNGRKITGIAARYNQRKHRVRKGKDYILHMKVESEKAGILSGRVERIRDLDTMEVTL